MIKSLSKSTSIMFLFDLLVFAFSTSIFYGALCGQNDFCRLNICVVALVVVAGLFSLFLKGQYKIREHRLTGWNAYRLFEGVVFAHIIPAIVLFFFISKLALIKFLGLNICAIFLCLYIYRLGFHYYLFYLKREKNILILGTDERARIIADEIQGKKALRMNVAGFVQCDNSDEFVADKNLPVYKDVTDLTDIINQKDIDIVVIAKATELIVTVPNDVAMYKMPEFYEMVTGKFYIDEKTITELYFQFAKNRSLTYDFCKRVYDIIAATIILVVTLPITGFTALRIWFTDHENPIYTQNRVGKSGKVFKCYKLRTMWANNYVPKDLKKGGYAENQEQDDRVIPWCKFVRKARFDEIPQMINILKGDMSIVGPRAEWEEVVKIYKEEIPYYNCRMWTKTGWTGWAQINQGHLFSLDDEEGKLVYDLYYIKHRNILWEISILIKAVFMALGGRHD